MDRGYLFLEGNLTKFNNLRLLPSTTMPARPDRGLAIQTIMFSYNALSSHMPVTPAHIQQFKTRQSLQKTVVDGSGIVVNG